MADEHDCTACGGRHRVVNGLPPRMITLDELRGLEAADSVVYTGPTAIHTSPDRDEMLTPMGVVMTRKDATVISLDPDAEVWLVTFRDGVPEDALETPGEYGMFINEMASQCIEAGYRCVEAWMEDGEPGGACPV